MYDEPEQANVTLAGLRANEDVFPASEGGYVDLCNWRVREWYPALEAAGIAKCGPYQLRHTFATEALAAAMSIFELARLMGCSVKVIDDT
jgi:integrase